jgi:hypothetical protein
MEWSQLDISKGGFILNFFSQALIRLLLEFESASAHFVTN